MAYENLDVRVASHQKLQGLPVGSPAEWLPARRVLMHTPGEELFLGVIHPRAAKFDDTFSVEGAKADHDAFAAKLLELGIDHVHTIGGILLAGTEDRQGEPYRRLVALALLQTTLDLSEFPTREREKERRYFREVIGKTDPRVLLRMVMQRATITLYKSGADGDSASCQRRFSPADYDVFATYATAPMMNMYFTRDHMITTAKGVVTGRMRDPVRRGEQVIIPAVLAQLGIEPLLGIQSSEEYLEGGDFLPAGDHAFIGVGMRTNYAAVHRMLSADVFGADTVIVVKDSWHNQQEMHLDTFFNIIDHDLVVLVADRIPPRNDAKKLLKADVWVKKGDRYMLSQKDADFVDVLRAQGYRVLPVSVEDQKAYGINFLTISGRRIACVEGVSDGYLRALAAERVQVTLVPFHDLKLGFGAAHCTTQVLHRSQ